MMPGPMMQFPISAECDSCGRREDFGYEIDMRIAARSRKAFTAAWLKDATRDCEDLLEQNGWLVAAGHVYCPDCAAGLEDGGIEPRHDRTDAIGLVKDLLYTSRLHRERREGRRKTR